MSLIILDFDGTIVSQNTHNILSQLPSCKNMDDAWEHVKNIEPVAGECAWLSFLTDMLQQGHSIAIASFNGFGQIIIPKYLEQVIGLNKDDLSKIHIESWMPDNPSIESKNQHIQYIIEDTQYKGSKETIILVDDTESHVIAAKNAGYKAIHAKDDFISKASKLATSSDRPGRNSLFAKFGTIGKKEQPTKSSCCLM